MMHNEAFGQRIRTALAVSRVSRDRIASICGCTRQAVQKWCDGTSYPSSAKLITISDATGASVEWLMSPYPLDIKSTEYAPGGVHVKTLIRTVIEEMDALAKGDDHE